MGAAMAKVVAKVLRALAKFSGDWAECGVGSGGGSMAIEVAEDWSLALGVEEVLGLEDIFEAVDV